MSYSRSYSETITVSGSETKTISYPASENGGSTTVTVYYTEYVPVDVNIHVDTNPFEAGVAKCNSRVNLLTTSVVATEVAQIASIASNAKKVGSTVVEGFFKTIRSEISQQIMELTQKIDSHLIHLRELAKSCTARQKQMETDYNRISSRYLKIFDDLNNELSNRIYELNKPAFSFKRDSDKQMIYASGRDFVSTVAVFGRESGELQAKISASIIKKGALDSIFQANVFLRKQAKTENTINQSMLNESIATTWFSPICFLETKNETKKINQAIFQSDFVPKIPNNKLLGEFQSYRWEDISKEHQNKIQHYFNSEVINNYKSNSLHDNRVKEMIAKIFDINSVKKFKS
jgi:hypothetical protein